MTTDYEENYLEAVGKEILRQENMTDKIKDDKLKENILKMNAKELQAFKWGNIIKLENKENSDCSGCSNCSGCFYCFYCSDCSDCSDCLYCRDFYNHKSGYYICNVEVTKEEYEKKMGELK